MFHYFYYIISLYTTNIIESSYKTNYNTKICLKLWCDTDERIRKTGKRKRSLYTGTIKIDVSI